MHSLEYNLERNSLPTDGGETDCELMIEPDGLLRGNLPLHIVFCVDSSGSMRGKPIKAVRKGVKKAADGLSKGDKFGVVEFDSSASVVVDGVNGNNVTKLRSSVESISASGNTNIMDGLDKSRTILSKMDGGSGGLIGNITGSGNDDDVIQWIVLLTDGEPNRTNESAFSDVVTRVTGNMVDKHAGVASALADQGITIHTAGVGGGYNEDIVEAISESSSGEWQHVSSGDKINRFFKDCVSKGRKVVATSPTLELVPKNGTTIDQVVQQIPQIADPNIVNRGGGYKISVPDINVDKPPRYSFQIDVPEQDVGKEVVLQSTLTVGDDSVSEDLEIQFNLPEITRDDRNGEVSERHDTSLEYLGERGNLDGEERAKRSTEIVREEQN